MKVVYKYPLHGFAVGVRLPADHRVVKVDVQHGVPVLWIEHPELRDGVELYDCRFSVFGTGHLIPDSAEYIGTYFEMDGALVWHVYEVAP